MLVSLLSSLALYSASSHYVASEIAKCAKNWERQPAWSELLGREPARILHWLTRMRMLVSDENPPQIFRAFCSLLISVTVEPGEAYPLRMKICIDYCNIDFII